MKLPFCGNRQVTVSNKLQVGLVLFLLLLLLFSFVFVFSKLMILLNS